MERSDSNKNIRLSYELSNDEKSALIRIWNRVYPKQIVHPSLSEFNKMLSTYKTPTHYLVRQKGQVAAWCCVFTRDHGRWFALIVDNQFQRRGIGKALLAKAKEDENELLGWMTTRNDYIKVDGTAYASPKEFYLANGFELTDVTFDSDVLQTVKIVWKRRA